MINIQCTFSRADNEALLDYKTCIKSMHKNKILEQNGHLCIKFMIFKLLAKF